VLLWIVPRPDGAGGSGGVTEEVRAVTASPDLFIFMTGPIIAGMAGLVQIGSP
jgi:hypothetical protein